ncbi:Uncharacterised protein [Salmonella enterica subsp. arizonae]|uniref:Uncharacterized protein n=1 Tax=Salmonella enterica subsp. arizonae TaxID=59203 RepID=A0A3S4K125_SALER|nr:Uncharacterised protein [Salmonella enterica subsp. arizonae]
MIIIVSSWLKWKKTQTMIGDDDWDEDDEEGVEFIYKR